MHKALSLLALFVGSTVWLVGADKPADKTQFDFETADDIKAWTNLELPNAKIKEPTVKIEFGSENATSGKHSLKLTFAGGQWPTVTTTQVTEDWLTAQTFHADVTASRPCVIGFTALLEKSQRGGEWEALTSRWTKTAFLKKGSNHITASIPDSNQYGVHAKRGKMQRFEIFMYAPHDGEVVYVDNIRLSAEKLPQPQKTEFKLIGTDITLSGNSSANAVQELGKKLKDGWAKPEPKTVADVEAAFAAKFADLKKKHPNAGMAILRDGEKGTDPKKPDAVYAGWKDAYWNSHGPDSNYADRAGNQGKNASQEIFMRHRSPLMQVDLSSIPVGSEVLAAQLLVVRANDKYLDDRNPEKYPTMWVVEPCNRAWEEYEVNAFQYAKDKFWKEIGGMSWGEDPDFSPVFLAHGAGQGKVNAWEFTDAVRYWTDGKHANYGFMLHGTGADYMTGHTREATDIKNRPAVLVIYAPK
ncbi:MAG: DNRLRE domain-containing protein [Planctomycetes bacterium]|nr:DNRLRE domain-containing protein [Planctomycetota bacterium]